MRPLASRRLTALAISAALTLGTAGPAVADELHPSSAADRAARAPLPDAAALLTQTKALADVGGVTTPVTELVTAALGADGGQVPAADAESLKARIQAAVDRAKETAPAPVPETPALPEPPVTPPAADTPVTPPAVDTPVTPPAVDTPVAPPAVETPAGLPVKPPVTLPVAAGAAAVKAGKAAPADLVDDALGTVEKAVAGLLAAVTSGDAAGVAPQVTATLTSLVNLAVATVLGSGLPAPDLAGLPALPALPVEPPALPVDPPVEAPELPVDPPVEPPALPVDAPVKPPVSAPELPVKPPLPVR
ncbi:hypothetical protein [Streptomyces hydrogenans]|uniref:Secreted protein n=1 Tax=Streptomyces hydrogenans TaxID=1873719 RepID=A0ABQ3P2C6_9ACTN|nr:hypothetical protein [Streptomyces hydrogenans]GHG25822.1 hypothetical protein GCM10018784_44130 [Streptomyces hydrogenans]GHI19177.1 hypothetical protein Shyd_05480 [Streptomyces hydrogenans]